MEALDRLREQRAARLLELLQSDLRAQVRVEQDAGRGQRRDRRARRQARAARLEDPAERQRLWAREAPAAFEGAPIRSLPKAREFWKDVDVTVWTKTELDAACALLDLPTRGRKRDLLARIQDWVLEPELLAERQRQKQRDSEYDAMIATGRVFAFGSNFNGQLGLGHRNACAAPTEIESFRGIRVKRVESGFEADFAFAISEDGRVFAWGGGGKAFFSNRNASSVAIVRTPTELNDARENPIVDLEDEVDPKTMIKPHSPGQDLTTSCFLLPQELPGFSALSIQRICCGRSGGHMALMTSTELCHIWGTGEYGENGVEVATTGQPLLQQVQTMGNRSARVISVSVGNAHTAAVTKDGELFSWGGNWNGQLGVGALRRGGVHDKRLRFCFPAPTAVESLSGIRINRVSCGAAHTGVVSTDGKLYMFGCGDGGRLGLGSNDDTSSPQLVDALSDMIVLDVCCGNWHTLCLATQRRSCQRTSLLTTSPSKKKNRGAATEFRSGDEEGGYVYSFGSGLQGQLGLGKQKTAALPTCIPSLQLRRVRCRSIVTSSLHCCALSTDGFLYTWGDNTNGCLGRLGANNNGSNATELSEPDMVDPESYRGYGVGPIVSVAVGRSFTIFATGPLARSDESRRDEFQQRGQLNALDRALGSVTRQLSRWNT